MHPSLVWSADFFSWAQLNMELALLHARGVRCCCWDVSFSRLSCNNDEAMVSRVYIAAAFSSPDGSSSSSTLICVGEMIVWRTLIGVNRASLFWVRCVRTEEFSARLLVALHPVCDTGRGCTAADGSSLAACIHT